jgi:hypothetical protein
VSVCVVDAAQGAADGDAGNETADDEEETLFADLPAEVTAQERQQLLVNLRAARKEMVASATDKVWGDQDNSTAAENPRGLSHALVTAGCCGVRVLVAVNKMDAVDASAADRVRTQLEASLYQIFNEDDDTGRIAVVGVGNDEAPMHSAPSTLAADLAPQVRSSSHPRHSFGPLL